MIMTIENLISIFKDYGYAHKIEQMPNIGYGVSIKFGFEPRGSEFYNTYHFTWNDKLNSEKNFAIFEEDAVYDSKKSKWFNEPGVKYYFTCISDGDGGYGIFSDSEMSDLMSHIYTKHLCHVFDKQTLRHMKLNAMEV